MIMRPWLVILWVVNIAREARPNCYIEASLCLFVGLYTARLSDAEHSTRAVLNSREDRKMRREKLPGNAGRLSRDVTLIGGGVRSHGWAERRRCSRRVTL